MWRPSSRTSLELYAGRGVNLVAGCGSMGVPHRGRPGLRAGPGRGRAAQALPCRHGDARDHRLPPARHPGRDRGDPRRRHLERHPRPPARDRLGSPARPAEGAGAAGDLRDDAGLPRAFRPRCQSTICQASRSSRARASSRGGLPPGCRCRSPPMPTPCARTRIRSTTTICISRSTRAPTRTMGRERLDARRTPVRDRFRLPRWGQRGTAARRSRPSSASTTSSRRMARSERSTACR